MGPPGDRASLSGNLENLTGQRCRRLVVEEAASSAYRGLRRCRADGFEVFFFWKGSPYSVGTNILRASRDAHTVYSGVKGRLGSQSLIDAHDEFGDVVQPCELRVRSYQLEECRCLRSRARARTRGLHSERHVGRAKSKTEGEKLLACG